MTPQLNICFSENSVPRGFSDWAKLWLLKSDNISKKIYLLSNNELEEALWIYNYHFYQNNTPEWTHR